MPERRRRVIAVGSAALVAAALVGGGLLVRGLASSGDVRPAASLVGTVWQLLGYGSRSDPHSSATLYLGADGRLVADDTCEVIGASARAGSGSLMVTERVIRYRSCTDSVGETVFTPGLAVLNGTSRYAVAGGELTIGSGAESLHLRAAPGTPRPVLDVPTLVGATWQLRSARGPDGAVPVDGRVRLRISDAGRLSAPGGCRRLSGHADVSGSRVDFAVAPTPAGGCSPPTGRLTAAVLDRRTEAIVSGATLTISRAGTGTLTYRWLPGDRAATTPAALVGRTWRLTYVAGKSAAAGQLRIAADGAVTGGDGCRAMSAHAAVRPGRLTITGLPGPAPRRCAGAATTVDSLLGAAATWAVRDGSLVIGTGDAQAFSLEYSAEPATGGVRGGR